MALSLKYICPSIKVQNDVHHGGFRVQLFLQASSDDMMEQLTHEELFETEAEAARLVRAIAKRDEIDLRYWVWQSSAATPFAALQEKPVATLKTQFYTPAF